jgi:hypothetical protein
VREGAGRSCGRARRSAARLRPGAGPVSPSRASSISDEPFWNYAVIGHDEFRRLLDAMASRRGQALVPGPYRPDGPEYYVEIEIDRQIFHLSLGFDHGTRETLRHMAAALEPDHRKPILDILVRIGQG